MSQPTYINSSTSISEPIKPFDGLDHNYTPEEYLQHIEARVTFSLGLQPTSEHEYKFWHARRMAFIQCSLTGTALSWYIRLNDTYKHDWHAFVQAFKKQFSSQKNAYYAQVEALNLTKKDNETVIALKVQQLVEKGWCNENASTINLKCNEIFTKELPKNLKDFANKRQVKHTSTVLEPSIPFHTLVNLVDAEDIANDKIKTHDLALEINNFTKQLNSQTLDPSSQEQLMFTQPKDPNNKNKPAYKKCCSYCHRTNHSISACFKKQRDDEYKREEYARSKSPQKSFVQNFRSPSNDRTKHYDNRYRSRRTSRDNSYNNTIKTIHKIDTVLHLEIDLVTIKVLLLHTPLDHDMIHTNVIPGPTVLLTDLHTDPHIDTTLVLDTDHAPIPETTNSQNIQIHTDHLQDQETLDFLDLAHTPIPETKLI